MISVRLLTVYYAFANSCTKLWTRDFSLTSMKSWQGRSGQVSLPVSLSPGDLRTRRPSTSHLSSLPAWHAARHAGSALPSRAVGAIRMPDLVLPPSRWPAWAQRAVERSASVYIPAAVPAGVAFVAELKPKCGFCSLRGGRRSVLRKGAVSCCLFAASFKSSVFCFTSCSQTTVAMSFQCALIVYTSASSRAPAEASRSQHTVPGLSSAER